MREVEGKVKIEQGRFKPFSVIAAEFVGAVAELLRWVIKQEG